MVACSQCGALKRDVNHWFIAWTDKSGQRFCFTSLDADPVMARESGVMILCGEWCLHQAIQKYTDSNQPFRRPSTDTPAYADRP
jgi:hypothetical protein